MWLVIPKPMTPYWGNWRCELLDHTKAAYPTVRRCPTKRWWVWVYEGGGAGALQSPKRLNTPLGRGLAGSDPHGFLLQVITKPTQPQQSHEQLAHMVSAPMLVIHISHCRPHNFHILLLNTHLLFGFRFALPHLPHPSSIKAKGVPRWDCRAYSLQVSSDFVHTRHGQPLVLPIRCVTSMGYRLLIELDA